MTNKKYQTYLNLARKAILSITCAAMLTLSCCQIALATEENSSSSGNTESSVPGTSINTAIGTEAAQNFAFADAGVDPLSVETVYTEYDYDDGEFLYEVDFTVEDTKYEYQIQAYEGSVLKKSIEYLGLKKTVSWQTDTATAITLEEAKELALADTELTDEELELVTFTKEKSDEDDGISIYDIEFYTDTAKYEYEISTRTGDILELSIDYRFTAQDLANITDTERDSAGSSSTSYISLDEAKNIALEYAGLSGSDVTFKKAKLDKEHGTMVYEIEFYQGKIEYECEINAVTGTVIEFEIDD
ncbi:MAG: PepSY domain-containing protein [Lachnospiraceae bacterium]|nr:PepSY domain-containing protein [Lachnospiraceae bacterium]